MNLKLFLSQKNIIDREVGKFYLLILLVCKVRLNCWFLILKMRLDFLKIFFVLFVFVSLLFFFLVFVVLFECIQLFVYEV